MKILITERQLKYIISEGRYSNPVFFKLATDMFNYFIEQLKTTSIGNDFYKTVKIILAQPEIDSDELHRLGVHPFPHFDIGQIINVNGLEEYIKLIDKDNEKLIDFITKISKDSIAARFHINLNLKTWAKSADFQSYTRNGELSELRITIYRYNLIRGVKTKNNYNVENSTNQQILNGVLYLKNDIIQEITHELQHAYDRFISIGAFRVRHQALKSDKEFHNFYNKFLKKELSDMTFDDDFFRNEDIKKLIRYLFQKREIWARIQEYFNEMNLEDPKEVALFYNENTTRNQAVHLWANRFVNKVLRIDLLNKIGLKDKIPLDKFKRYLYKVFYQMLSYKVKLIMDNQKK